MPLKARSSARRRRKSPDEERSAEAAPSSAQVMAPTRMKLRVRRRDNAAAGAAGRGAPPEEEEEQRSRESGSRRKSASRSSAAAATTTSSSLSPPTSSASTSARPPMMAAEEASPDSKCPICLDRFNKLAYLDRCKHRFCFPCIQEWSHKKPECPLCKQPFTSIFHRNHAEDDFKEYSLRPAPASSSVASTVAMVAAMASAARNSHQMRLMLRRHRVPETGETTTRRRRRERGGRRAEERAGIWEWYLDSPTLPLPPLPHPPVVTEDSEDGEEQGIRGGAEMAERGVVFEGLTGLGGAVAPIAPNDRASRQLMSRLAARQRLQREGGTVRRLRERETVAFRRELYRCGIRVRGIGGIPENQWQWQRDVTAEGFRQNPAHLNRLRPWLRRELTVLYGSHTSLVDIVQRIIIARLARYGLENTPIIEEELRPFLLARTEHFMHELVSFARSPLSLDNYDLQAVYEPPDAAVELDGMSSSSEGSSVIAISEEEEERTRGGGSEERPEREGGAHDDIIQTASVLSLSGWDDETPGPSYSTAEPSSSFSPALPEAANQDGGERLEEEEECLIVGYKKPIAERTPELVQLSSDTEEEEEKKKKEEELPPPPSATPPLSYLSMIPPSTSGTYREEQDKGQKDGEVAGQHARARSWSGSSGRSRSSVCTLSPATPGDSERRRETGSWRDRKSAGEASREKRRKRKRERSTDRHRKSGTLFNPNRSIYPAMMRHRSPSPFDSSADSSSLPSPSPPDSSWEYPCAQVSPLTSSVSSPSHSSSSPRPPPPPRTPPTPSLSPSNRSGPHHGEKPGGKRKYKSRHLDNNVKDPTWRPSSSGGGRKEKRKERRRRRERERGRRRERHRRVSSGYGGESSRRSREDRSPSVEIIYEGTITSEGVQPSARKRRRKRHRKAQQSSSPVIITLDSDSSRDDPNNKNSGSISSSPLSSQQTVDFSDLPPLPLVHSAGVSSVLDAEIGDLPVDILDRGSGSDTEPAGQSKATVQGYSDHEVDVENVDDDVEGPVTVTKTPDPESQREAGTAGEGSQPMGEHDAAHVMTDLLHKRLPEASTSDSHLLASILSDLDRISAPKCEASLNIEARCSPDSRKRRYRDPCAVSQAHQQQGGWVADFPEEQQSDVRAQNQESTSIDSPPPLKQWKECRVGEEGRDAPPLLRQASPVRSYNRNTPPPLKHKDAGSPRHSPLFNSDLRSHHASSDPVLHSLNPTDSPSDSRLAAKLPNDSEAIPPISTLKRHLTSMLALSGDPASTSSISAKARALTTDFHPSGHRLPVGTSSSFGCETTPTAADYYSFNPSALHSSRESTMGISSSHSPVDLNPVTSSSNTDFHSAAGWSKETPAHPHSTSRGCVNKTTNSFWPPLVDLHPFSSVAGAPPAGSRVSSGVNSHDTLLPVSVTDPRTQKASSPSDSPSSSNLSLIGSTAAPSSMPSTMNLHPVDFHSSSAASGGRTDRDTTLAVSREERLPPELDCRGPNLQSSCLTEARLNHTAFSSSSAPPEHSISFHTSHKTSKLGTDSSLFHPNHVDPRSKHNLPPDSEPPPPKFSRRGFEHHTDNHITPESQRNSNSPTDAHPYERSAT